MNSSVPITGGAVIPVSASDVANIIPIALVIPDFEGSATLRIFSNSTQTQIGCFQAVMTNGNSFSHPAAVSSILGIFTVIAVAASFVTAIYGVSVPHVRTHYAHSLSVLVVFEVFQSIFFSGMLSVNWPSVLAAWWSNFAWSAGQIYSPSMIRTINSFAGVSGNSSQVGGAGSSTINNNGGLQQQIYGRDLQGFPTLAKFSTYNLLRRGEDAARRMAKRATSHNNISDPRMFSWAGLPVSPGLPIPGNWSNYEGDLLEVGIPVADSFMVGFLWFIILLVILVGATVAFKFLLELLSRFKLMKQDRLALFRNNWLGFLGLVVLRTCFIGFFMMMTLSLFQFSYGGKAGPIAIAAIVFLIFFIGAFGVAFYACFYRARFGTYKSEPDPIHFQKKKIMKFIPWYKATRESSMDVGDDKTKTAGSMAFPKIQFVSDDAERQSVHEDSAYTKRFGWLSARYRRTRWWFFAFWVVYQFVRACFLAGAQKNPNAQVFGNFIWELIAFITIICINPFEGARNTALAVYMLGISKVATAGLSIAFLPHFNVARIPTTVIGVIIIVIQGFLTIGLMILILLGAVSSYMSITRNQEEIKPRNLENIRAKYFEAIEKKAADLPPPPPVIPEEPVIGFSVKKVRRAPKIEDEDVDFVPEMQGVSHPAAQSQFSLANRPSRSNSMASNMSNYGSVPYGARVHRASWSSHDFQQYREEAGSRGDSRAGTMRSQGGDFVMSPLVKPKASQTSMRPLTPTREQTEQSEQKPTHAN